MNFRSLIAIIVLLNLSNCRPSIPELQIEKDQMIKILMDVHVAEGALQNYYGDEKDSLAEAYYQQIYQFHNIDSLDLSLNLEILRKNPELLHEVYTEVVEELSKQESESFKDKYKQKK